MLDIPTAKGARAGTRTPEQRERYLGRQATKTTQPESMGGVPGATSLPEQPAPYTGPAVSDWASQYGATADRQASGWQDPIAAEVGRKYFGGIQATGGGGGNLYDKYVNEADTYSSGKYGGYMSPLDPMKWGSGGYGFEPQMKADYIAAGGKAFEQAPTAPGMALPGQPYNAATGMAAPVMSATGVPVNPNTGQFAGSVGSSHTLNPNIINRMWR